MKNVRLSLSRTTMRHCLRMGQLELRIYKRGSSVFVDELSRGVLDILPSGSTEITHLDPTTTSLVLASLRALEEALFRVDQEVANV